MHLLALPKIRVGNKIYTGWITVAKTVLGP